MEISVKKLAIGGAVILIAGLAIGRFTLPSKVVTKTEVKVETKEVVKWKTKYVKQENKDKETITIETRYPDGRIVKEKRVLDKGVVVVDKTSDGAKEVEKKEERSTETTTTYAKNDWHLSALVSSSNNGEAFSDKVSYGLMLERRIIGPFYLGVFGLSNKTVGAGLGVSF